MAYTQNGPVMVQEQATPVDGVSAPAGNSSAYSRPAQNGNGAPAHPKDEDDSDSEADVWDDLLEAAEEQGPGSERKDEFNHDEARQIRQRLHKVGADQFVREYITSEKCTARKLLAALNVRLPDHFMDDEPDEVLYELLGRAICRELQKRTRLEQYKTIDDAAKLLRERKNIMVITGAGISTSLGIPDFRSKDTGFYSELRQMGFAEPEEVFNIDNFDENPHVFYRLAGKIVPDLKKWSPTHQFIRTLQDKDKLLTNYTQNIDNVEAQAGIRPDKLIQCHGSWATATCRKCKYQVKGEDIFDAVRARQPAQCPRCVQGITATKSSMKRKRSSNGSKKRRGPGEFDDDDSDGAYDIPEPGIMKPDITFFGEQLPNKFFEQLKEHDRDKVDLIIVIGTSMKVQPVCEIPHFVPRDVPQIYISRDPIHHISFDINLLGDCDVVVTELARRAGWDFQHKMIPKDQRIEVSPVDAAEHTYKVTSRV
ncbi:SIR2-domain-containing protein [Bimuria novae-zelandiae CBS 107.79]|uniref:SIR2-domain-containing protein n=1 Tax=Bimuria novae-zelandiae CBS 107.79 TaxID=1447943 RepID=A0A6A5V095_9PLEO|nr:SIR2-domain-containing protein [Bimuria novae-zelandiae CBS 107.79]